MNLHVAEQRRHYELGLIVTSCENLVTCRKGMDRHGVLTTGAKKGDSLFPQPQIFSSQALRPNNRWPRGLEEQHVWNHSIGSSENATSAGEAYTGGQQDFPVVGQCIDKPDEHKEPGGDAQRGPESLSQRAPKGLQSCH